MTSVQEIILHYNKSILNSKTNNQRLLHCIRRLFALDITVNDLQVSRIGRTVSALRKYDGEVGVDAKALIAKWKTMVAEESESSDSKSGETTEDEKSPPFNRPLQGEEYATNKPDNFRKTADVQNKIQKNLSGNREQHHNKQNSNEQTSLARIPVNVFQESEEVQRLKQIDNSSRHRHNSNGQTSSGKHHTSNSDEHRSKDRSHREHHKINATTQPVLSSTRHGKNGMTVDNEKNRLNVNIRNKDVKDNKHHSNERRNERRASSGDERRCDKNKSSRSSEKGQQHRLNEKLDGHKSSKDEHIDKSSHHRKPEEKSDDNRSSSKRKRDSADQSSSSKDKHSVKSSCHRNTEEKSDESSASNKRKPESVYNSPSSSVKNNAGNSKNKRQKIETPTVDEIDSSMGTSFADALGMMMPKLPKASKQKNVVKTTTPSTSKVATNVSSKIPSKVASKASSSSSRNENKNFEASTQQPKLLSSSAKLPPLEPVIAVDFPIISNNYKPLPLNPTVMDCVFNTFNQPQPKKMITDEEAFGSAISSKSMRTKVYSGVKTGTIVQIPSLYQICIRFLQKNIDALEQTGSIPFDILKPVLQLATPQQLFTIEAYNPYLLEDTDVLWEFHSKKKFRTSKRLECETWRDMFLRCTEEQELRLNNLTNTIKQSQTIAIPVKTTKLAYVNSTVKPPRGVIKKQNQYGTERKLVATPAARVPSLTQVCSNISKPGDVRLRVAAGLRDMAQVTSNSTHRPKKAAPLMAKTLQSIRSRFKR